jgi:hypothetical protein
MLTVLAACWIRVLFYILISEANTSDISIENKTHTYQAANTSDIIIENKIRICQLANTSYISMDNKMCTCEAVLISDVLAAW